MRSIRIGYVEQRSKIKTRREREKNSNEGKSNNAVVCLFNEPICASIQLNAAAVEEYALDKN